MSPRPLTPDTEFTVKEEKWLNIIMTFLFTALFLYGLVDAVLKGPGQLDYQSIFFALALIPAGIFFRKARSKRIYIRINRTGIYQDEKLVTDWKHFLKASIGQQEKTISIQDNFILVVEYLREEAGKGYRRKIPLTNTQNQAEEDVLAAIRYFWQLYHTGMPV